MSRSMTDLALVLKWRDAWCAKDAIIRLLEFTNVATDKDFSSIVVPSSFLPVGYTLVAVNLILKWRKMMEDSTVENYINGASKSIRVKVSTGAWGVDDIVAMTMKNGSWIVAASGIEGGDVLISTTDIKSVVTGVAATYNIRSEQTNRTDAIVVLADGMTLYDVETGVRMFYTL